MTSIMEIGAKEAVDYAAMERDIDQSDQVEDYNKIVPPTVPFASAS